MQKGGKRAGKHFITRSTKAGPSGLHYKSPLELPTSFLIPSILYWMVNSGEHGDPGSGQGKGSTGAAVREREDGDSPGVPKGCEIHIKVESQDQGPVPQDTGPQGGPKQRTCLH